MHRMGRRGGMAAANEMLTQMVEEQRISSSLEVHNE